MARPIGANWMWGSGVVLSAALAVGLLPPEPLNLPAEREPVPGPAQAERAMALEIGRARDRIERDLIEETLGDGSLQIRFLAPSRAGSGRPALQPVSSTEADELAERVRGRLEEAGRTYGVDDPMGALALVYGPQDLLMRRSGPSASGTGRRGTWTQEIPDGRHRCVSRTTAAGPVGLAERAEANGDWILTRGAEACLLTYWFGEPGPAVGEWYGRLGQSFARTLPGTRPWGAWPKLERGAFGRRSGWGLIDDLAVDRCRTGALEVCRAGFLGVEPSGALGGSETWQADTSGGPFRSPFRGWGDGLLFDLLLEAGPQRFQDFWTSDLAVGEAFREAFQEEPGAWVRDRLVLAVGPGEEGPAPGPREAAGVLTLLLGCSFWSGLRARRRRAALGQG